MAYEYGAKEPEKLKIKDMTPREKELLIDSENFCMLPWMHLHAFPDGRAYPCCFALDKLHVGNVNENSMEEVFNGDKMKQMRLNMLANKRSRECAKCYDQEDSGFFSLRLSSNKHFGHNISMTENTKPDGTADFIIKYWDIRFSNLCNMACRMCSPTLSSLIQTENREWQKNDAIGMSHNYNWIDEPSNVAKIIDLINKQDIKQIQMQGGEPQLMKGFVDIITQIDNDKRSQIELQVTTNASIFNEKFWEQAIKFQMVTAGISIDATGSRYDVIRYHGDWDKTEKNCIKILEYLWDHRIEPGPKPSLNLNIVLQLANVDQCDAMDSFYTNLQKRLPGINTCYTLAPIFDLDPFNPWDIKNLPIEILKGLPDIKSETELAKQWGESINYSIENNSYNKQHREKVLAREEHFLKVHSKNLWNEKPDWFEIYNRQID